MDLITILLTVYIWGTVSLLLLFLYAIARFYQKKSGRRSYYPAFAVAAFFLGVAAVRYIWIVPAIIGDMWGDLFRFLGSLILSGFGIYLLKLMMGRRS